jgi:uncharacterized protein YggU (UPF0235/DUF167 family)
MVGTELGLGVSKGSSREPFAIEDTETQRSQAVTHTARGTYSQDVVQTHRDEPARNPQRSFREATIFVELSSKRTFYISSHTREMRLEIHVRPRASTSDVGGNYDGALVVRVTEAPEAGEATAAALGAVAQALRLPRRSVTLLRGSTSRRKLVDIAVGSEETRVLAAVEQLLSDEGRHQLGSR